jgi:hypothetical protein
MTQSNLDVVSGAFRAIIPGNRNINRLSCDLYLDTKSYFNISPLLHLDELALHAEHIEMDMTMRLNDIDLKDSSRRSVVAQLLMPRNFEKRSSGSVCWNRIALWGDPWPCDYKSEFSTAADRGDEPSQSIARNRSYAASRLA